MPPTYLFAFRDEAAALRFVERLCFVLRHIAVYRDGPHVKVYDGGDTDQGDQIVRLARESSAQQLIVKD
jgi:hypothetical protein